MYATFNVLVSSGASVYHRSFSMKESWKFSKEKLISAEEGLKSAEPVTRGSICSCHRLIQCAKLVLYIELILFLGWSSYTLWQAYDQQGEIKFFNVICPDNVATHDIESSKILNEVLTESPLKVVEDSTDKIKIKENGPLQEDAFPTDVPSIYDQLDAVEGQLGVIHENHLIADSTESSISNEDEEFKSLENRPVFDWGFPFLWNIHQDNTPFTDDSWMVSRQELDESLVEDLKHLSESDEKEQMNPVLETRGNSLEEETQQQDKMEESNFSSDGILSSAEIINMLIKRYEQNLKAILEDSYMKNVGDMSLEKEENSKMDSAFSRPASPFDSNEWGTLTQESTERIPISKESTESSIVFPDTSTSEEFPTSFHWGNLNSDYFNTVTLSEHDDSEKSDTSEVDKTTTDLTSDIWDQSFEVNPSDESTEGNTHEETITVADFAEDYRLERKPPIKIYLSLSQKEHDDFVQETSHEPVLPNNSSERVVGNVTILHIDRSSESSDPTDSKSDDSTEEYHEFTEKNHWPVPEIAKETNISDNTDLSNEKSDFHSTVIEIEDKPIETSTRWDDSSSVFSEIEESEWGDFARGWSRRFATEPSESESSQSESSQSDYSQDYWLEDYYGDLDR